MPDNNTYHNNYTNYTQIHALVVFIMRYFDSAERIIPRHTSEWKRFISLEQKKPAGASAGEPGDVYNDISGTMMKLLFKRS